jgi:hypothetical protein
MPLFESPAFEFALTYLRDVMCQHHADGILNAHRFIHAGNPFFNPYLFSKWKHRSRRIKSVRQTAAERIDNSRRKALIHLKIQIIFITI